MPAMEMRCAECGCFVDRGEVVQRCGDPDCCCQHLPDKKGAGGDADMDRTFPNLRSPELHNSGGSVPTTG